MRLRKCAAMLLIVCGLFASLTGCAQESKQENSTGRDLTTENAQIAKDSQEVKEFKDYEKELLSFEVIAKDKIAQN